MPETVVVAAASLVEARRFIEAELTEEDKPVIVCDGREVHHLVGLTPDRVVRLPGYFKRDDRAYVECALLACETLAGLR